MEKIKSDIKDFLNFLTIPLCGGVATYFGDSLSYPFETITTTFKKQHFHRKVHLVTIKNSIIRTIMYYSNGVSTVFYSAFFTNFVYFTAYEGLSRYGTKKLKKTQYEKYLWMVPTISAFVGEALSLFVFVPVDCIQTRIQSGIPEFAYKGMGDGVRKIIKNEGFGRLFFGMHVYMMHNLLFMPIIFTIYEKRKQMRIDKKVEMYKNNNEPVPHVSYLFSIEDSIFETFFATIVSTLITNPLYTILVRFQVTDYAKAQYMRERIYFIIRLSYQVIGWRGLNIGLLPRTITTALSAILYLPVYEYARTICGHESEI